MKIRKNKRSLTNLKRTEPSTKEAAYNEFVKMVIDGDIDLDSLIPDEGIPDSILAQYPSVDEIMEEVRSATNGEIEHDLEVIEDILAKHGDHPQNVRIQMTMLNEIAKKMNAEQKAELFKFATDKNAADLEPDKDLTDKIFDTANLLNQNRKTKAIKNLQACIRRIEAKRTPRTCRDLPVFSLETIIEEKLFLDGKDAKATNYYQPPAPYSLAYQMYAETMMNNGDYAEAFNAFEQAISWNPVSPAPLLCMANMLVDLDDNARAIEFLEKAYPFITEPSHLAHFYILHAGMLACDCPEDDKATLALCEALERLSQMIMLGVADIPEAPMSRDAFENALKEHNIPFGASPKALDVLKSAIAEIGEDADLRDQLESNLEKLQKCTEFDAI